MQYKLIGDNNFFTPIETVLRNRGIKNIEEFLNASDDPSVTNHYSKLKNIEKAVDCLMLHITNDSLIFVQVDSDADGYSSSAILINYLKEQYPDINIQWRLHEGKEHGIKAEHVPDDVDLVIVPDAGSSDYEEHKKLYNKGINIIVLDHHLTDKESQHAIVVNNQISPEFPNKNLSGVGVVFKFLEALDNRLGIKKAKNYLDFVALGIVGDVMDLRELENRYYIAQGLQNLKNPMLKEMFKELEYSTKGQRNPMVLGWYISPLINAVIRSGTMQEKEQVFKAFLDDGTSLIYNEKKDRYENLLTNTIQVMKNVRQRQNKARDEGVKLIEQRIEEKNLLDNKVLIVNVTDILDKDLTGYVANKLMDKYKRPVLLLRYNNETDTLSGSARGYHKGVIKDFRQYLLNTQMFDYVEGHANAFGVSINRERLIEVNDYINEDLKDVDIGESVYEVDFVIPAKQIGSNFIKEIDNHKDLWGHGIEEPLIVVEQIEVEKRNINLLGRNKDTMKFSFKAIDFIKFNIKEDEYKQLTEGDKTNLVVLNVVGKAMVNEWKNKRTPQIEIVDYELKEIKEREFIF